MKTIGLTGGIGSGKSTAAKIFELWGIPVFYADQAGRNVLAHDPIVREKVSSLLGPDAYKNGSADRKGIAAKVFSNPGLLAKLNAIVHPAVGRAFDAWKMGQNPAAPYVMKEAAILFESGTYKECDHVLFIAAPEELRLKRVMMRDGVSRGEVLSRVQRQWPEEKKEAMARFVAVNDERCLLVPQLLAVHYTILS